MLTDQKTGFMPVLHCRFTLRVPAEWVTGGSSTAVTGSFTDSALADVLSKQHALLSPAGSERYALLACSADQATSQHPSRAHRSISSSRKSSSSTGASSAGSTSYVGVYERVGQTGSVWAAAASPRTSSIGSSSRGAVAGTHNEGDADTQQASYERILRLLSPAGPDTVAADSADQATSQHPSHAHKFINTATAASSSSSTGASSSASRLASDFFARAVPSGSGNRLLRAAASLRASNTGSSSSSSSSGAPAAASGTRNAHHVQAIPLMPGVTTQDLTAPFARRGRRPPAAFIESKLGVCSKVCDCAAYASTVLQWSDQMRGIVRGYRPECDFLPTLAAKLFDPASKHKLVGVQDALREFHK